MAIHLLNVWTKKLWGPDFVPIERPERSSPESPEAPARNARGLSALKRKWAVDSSDFAEGRRGLDAIARHVCVRLSDYDTGRDVWLLADESRSPMRDPQTVAAIVSALRHVHGDDTARAMLTNGTTLAALIDALLLSPMTNRDAVKLMTRALRSKDFIVTPDFSSMWHVKYVYDSPKSLNVVDLAIITLDHGTFASTDVRLLLQVG